MNRCDGMRGYSGYAGSGAEEGSDNTAFSSWLAPLTQIAAGVYAESQDPVRQVAILTAQLQNAYARGASTAEIALLQAKLSAAKQALATQQATERSRWEWTNLGKVGTVVGIALGVGLLYRVIRD